MIVLDLVQLNPPAYEYVMPAERVDHFFTLVKGGKGTGGKDGSSGSSNSGSNGSNGSNGSSGP